VRKKRGLIYDHCEAQSHIHVIGCRKKKYSASTVKGEREPETAWNLKRERNNTPGGKTAGEFWAHLSAKNTARPGAHFNKGKGEPNPAAQVGEVRENKVADWRAASGGTPCVWRLEEGIKRDHLFGEAEGFRRTVKLRGSGGKSTFLQNNREERWPVPMRKILNKGAPKKSRQRRWGGTAR